MAVNCGISCTNERKAVTKELQKWSRNLLHMVGLECVIKAFVKSKSWQSISPFITLPETDASTSNTIEDIQQRDWNPLEPCRICARKKKLQKELEKQPGVSRKRERAAISHAPDSSSKRQAVLGADENGVRKGPGRLELASNNLPTSASSKSNGVSSHMDQAELIRADSALNPAVAPTDQANSNASAVSAILDQAMKFNFDQLFYNNAISANAAFPAIPLSALGADVASATTSAARDSNAYVAQLISWYQQHQASSTANSLASFYGNLFGMANQHQSNAPLSFASATEAAASTGQTAALYLQSAPGSSLRNASDAFGQQFLFDGFLPTATDADSLTQHANAAAYYNSLLMGQSQPLMQHSASAELQQLASAVNSSSRTKRSPLKQEQSQKDAGRLLPQSASRTQQLSRESTPFGAPAPTVEETPLDLTNKRSTKPSKPGEKHFNSNEASSIDDTSSNAESPGLSDSAIGCSTNGAKKTYTQSDLDTAVDDIRNGRLGTRRASVVYGIPRSTLRNKVYKLETGAMPAAISSSEYVEETTSAVIKKEKLALPENRDGTAVSLGYPIKHTQSPVAQAVGPDNAAALENLFQYYTMLGNAMELHGDAGNAMDESSRGSLRDNKQAGRHKQKLPTPANTWMSQIRSLIDGYNAGMSSLSSASQIESTPNEKTFDVRKSSGARAAAQEDQAQDKRALNMTSARTRLKKKTSKCVERSTAELLQQLSSGAANSFLVTRVKQVRDFPKQFGIKRDAAQLKRLTKLAKSTETKSEKMQLLIDGLLQKSLFHRLAVDEESIPVAQELIAKPPKIRKHSTLAPQQSVVPTEQRAPMSNEAATEFMNSYNAAFNAVLPFYSYLGGAGNMQTFLPANLSLPGFTAEAAAELSKSYSPFANFVRNTAQTFEGDASSSIADVTDVSAGATNKGSRKTKRAVVSENLSSFPPEPKSFSANLTRKRHKKDSMPTIGALPDSTVTQEKGSTKRESENRSKGAAATILNSDRSDDEETELEELDEDRPNTDSPLRPKRGQYRKYDKQALAEAVRSVRHGHMSVHRAGSFYNIPHSTLEYKVKERNLLRPRKRKLSKQTSPVSSSDNNVPTPCPSESSAARSATATPCNSVKPNEPTTSSPTSSADLIDNGKRTANITSSSTDSRANSNHSSEQADAGERRHLNAESSHSLEPQQSIVAEAEQSIAAASTEETVQNR